MNELKLIKRNTTGFMELVLVSFIWGLTYTILKYSLETLAPAQIAFFRFFVSSLLFIPILLIFREKYSSADILRIIALALTGVMMYQLFFIYGEKGMSAGNASFVVSMEPIFIVLFSVALREDKLHLRFLLGIAIATVGLIVLLQPQSMKLNEYLSVLLILIAAASWGVYTVLGRKLLAAHNPVNVTAMVSVIGAVMLFPFSGTDSISILVSLRGNALAAILFLGILATFLGYILWFDGLKYVKASVAGTTLYLTPFVTVLTADFMLSEAPSLATVAGGLLITMGIAISNIKMKNE